MRTFVIGCLLLVALPLHAATLQVEVNRNGYAEAMEILLAPRVEGSVPEWSQRKTLAADASAVTFRDVGPGLYTVLARGSRPLERLGARANVGAGANTLRLAIPKTNASLRVTVGGAPLARATVTLAHDELKWDTELTTSDDGTFAGPLWEPAVYAARVLRDRAAAPHVTSVELRGGPLTIDVPDRHITGRVTSGDGRPVGGAAVMLRSEASGLSLNVRTRSAPDGRFEFFGVPEGAHSLFARAPSYLQSDAVSFELREARATRVIDFHLSRGVQRTARVVDHTGAAKANAALFVACDGHVKSTSVTNAEGVAAVALPENGSCAVYAAPKDGSLGVAYARGAQNLEIKVPAGSSSLDLTLQGESGEAFTDLSLLMRIDGVVVPPAVARQLTRRGFSLMTNAEGRISLQRIPPGTYEFWPYRTEAEGRMIYDIAAEFAAPISVNVATGENDATVKFKTRR